MNIDLVKQARDRVGVAYILQQNRGGTALVLVFVLFIWLLFIIILSVV